MSDFKQMINKINRLRRLDQAKRSIGLSMLAITSQRIFSDGKDASNRGIGTYSDAYMKVRRKKNYPASTKVILQAERQMVLDFTLIVSEDGWGLGFKNDVNFQKSLIVEKTYQKDIFAHTDFEVAKFRQLFQNEVNRILNAN
jgi:hypothetical protein